MNAGSVSFLSRTGKLLAFAVFACLILTGPAHAFAHKPATAASSGPTHWNDNDLAAETQIGLLRFYELNLQRWLNQDPLGEAGGINLYGFVGNDSINFLDSFGLEDTSIHAAARKPGALREFAREYLREVECDLARKRIQREVVEKALKELRSSPRTARRALRKVLGEGEGLAPHIAPLEVRVHPIAQRAAQGGFNWNAQGNAMRLPQWLHKGFNEWHRTYNQGWKNLLDDISTRYKYFARNAWGKPTAITETYTSGSSVAARTSTL